MHAISLNVDTQGKIALPVWLQQQLGIGAGSQVKVLIEKEPVSKLEKPAFESGFGMLKTDISVDDTGFDVSVFAKDNETQPKKRQAGALAHLFKENEDIGRVFLEPMSEEELAWWNGDYTDKFGISLSKENGNVE